MGNQEFRNVHGYYIFKILVTELLNKGYAITEFNPTFMRATFKSQKGDIKLKLAENAVASVIIQGRGVDPQAPKTANSMLVITTDSTVFNKGVNSLLQTNPPTGIDILSTFVSTVLVQERFMLLKTTVTMSGTQARVDLENKGELRTFTMETPTSKNGTPLICKQASIYATTPQDILMWVMSQERRYI